MWIYKDTIITSIEDVPEGSYGFIYKVTHKPTHKKYLGKKVLHYNKTLPPLKGKKRKRKVVVESDWKKYYGSEQTIKQLIKEGKQDEFTREILQFVPTKKLLTYYETKLQFSEGVLEDDIWLNSNILGKFFKNDFVG